MKTLLTFFLIVVALTGQTITTDHADNSRLSAITETSLTPSNILSGFGNTANIALTGKPYTQPLYVPALTVAAATHNVLFTTDNTNTVYAHDADTFTLLWSRTLDTACTSACTGGGWSLSYDQPVGIQGTPVIDVANGWLFAVTRNNTPLLKLWKLNLLTGAVIGSSVTLTATASPSTASDAVAGTLTFNPALLQQRTGLTLANSTIYITTGSVRDVAPWHGWVLAYRESDLVRTASFCANINQTGGGVWMSGSGPSVDASGNLYVVTGNGGTDSGTYTSSYDGVTEFSMSILKLSPALALLDWYTPADYATQNAADTDLGSSHPMLIPNPASAGNYLLVTGGKDFKVYSVHSECMGHLGGTVGGCPGAQVFATGSASLTNHTGIYGDAHLNGVSYFPNTAGALYAFTLQNSGLYNTTPVVGSVTAFPGAMLTASSNGASNPILWALNSATDALTSPASGTLSALNATTLATIWTSANFGINKFLSPTVANGKVYVPTYDGTIAVFGAVTPGPPGSLSGKTTLSGAATLI